MTQSITWLHLSDLHACKPKTSWDARRVTQTLCNDLQYMEGQYGLRPDLIFFTGDAAYGQIGTDQGKAIVDQFQEAHDFLTAVREVFSPTVEQRNLFLVPGNHDVNRKRISTFETRFLQQIESLDEIQQVVQEAGLDWQRLLGRLDDYASCLERFGYDHLLTQRDRLIYADAREVAGVRVGIAGFNSAWSAQGGREDLGKLWMAGRFQLETIQQAMPPHDIAIALLHHPNNWLVAEENPSFGRLLEREFTFVLHGHEHLDFVRTDASTGHTVISAGACHEWSESRNNGYNFVRLNLEAGTGEVWLRQYESTGGGWVSRPIKNRTNDQGCWILPAPTLDLWMGKLAQKQQGVLASQQISIQKQDSESSHRINKRILDPAADYEERYRKAIASKLDYLQLFGIKVPRESQEYSLTVAYVSLNLADETEEGLTTSSRSFNPNRPTSISAEYFFDALQLVNKRLLIRGPAGCGKTTLLRWAAVQAGKFRDDRLSSRQLKYVSDEAFFNDNKLNLVKPEGLRTSDGRRKDTSFSSRDDSEDKLGDVIQQNELKFRRFENEYTPNWRAKVPFLIRLRDYPNGKLPRPQQFPLLLAKELPDPPEQWVDEVLRQGRGLVMLDGMDEVPPNVRSEVIREVRQLMNTYPDCYYVVTTRPEAIEGFEFQALGFMSARVEPMSPLARDTLIDRWHEAMEVLLRKWKQPEDLRPLTQRLKQRLAENRSIERLTVNPLLCTVVCALHRERNENLPETPVELCEKLCEMLLHRRDQERPGLDEKINFDTSYSCLKFPVRKGLLSKLAYEMVVSGVSSISEADADVHIADALRSYTITNINSTIVRQALVERSGMLQESSEQRIEFLHNTLKEFLAAERLVNMENIEILAENIDNPAWQPVILFALAIPRDGSSFATNLLRKILERTPLDPPQKGRSKQQREAAVKQRARQFFFFRCYTNAYQCNAPEITQVFEILSKQLLPLRTMSDAEALANAGEDAVPFLKNHKGLKAIERAANVRALCLIGSPFAWATLQSYFEETSEAVRKEILNAIFIKQIFKITGDLKLPKSLTNLTNLDLSSTQISDITPLSNLVNLTNLDLSFTQVSDITPLLNLSNLTTLDLKSTQISDITPLSNLVNLTNLDLSSTQVSDITPLSNLVNLKTLDLSFTQVSNVTPLLNLVNLTILVLKSTQVSDVTSLSSLFNLTALDLSSTHVQKVIPLSNLIRLTSLDLSSTLVSNVKPLYRLINLTNLDLKFTQVSNVKPLSNLVKLTSLRLSSTQVSDIKSLSNLVNLTSLGLSSTQVSDIKSLSNLVNLTNLGFSFTSVSDIKSLSSLVNLTSLGLNSTQVSDVTPLSNLVNLTTLDLEFTQVSDVTPLSNLINLTSLDLKSTQVSDITSLSSLVNLTILDLSPGIDIVGLDTFQNTVPHCRSYRW
jgi:Leucine-rich repeat (LRR) protein